MKSSPVALTVIALCFVLAGVFLLIPGLALLYPGVTLTAGLDFDTAGRHIALQFDRVKLVAFCLITGSVADHYWDRPLEAQELGTDYGPGTAQPAGASHGTGDRASADAEGRGRGDGIRRLRDQHPGDLVSAAAGGEGPLYASG
jgi:hypothetical protein